MYVLYRILPRDNKSNSWTRKREFLRYLSKFFTAKLIKNRIIVKTDFKMIYGR